MKEKATSAAASLMASTAAIGAVFTPELERFDSLQGKAGLTLVSAIGLYTVFAVARRLLLRFHYRKLLGRWYYATREHEGVRFIDRNVALMEFKLGGDGDLAYVVHLYPTADALGAAIERRRTPSSDRQRGRAKSIAIAYDVDQGRVEVLFSVGYTTGRIEDCDRRGVLTLQFRLDGTLGGEYVSQIWEFGEGKAARGLSSGVVYATRSLDDLKAHLSPAVVEPPTIQQDASVRGA